MLDTPTAVHNFEPSLRPRVWRRPQPGSESRLLVSIRSSLKKVPISFPCGSDGKETSCNAEDPGSILGWKDALEKGMAIHSNILAWQIPWTEKSDALQSMVLQRVRHNSLTNTFAMIQTTTKPKWNSS